LKKVVNKNILKHVNRGGDPIYFFTNPKHPYKELA